ncbi:MAG: zinc ABC transporter substrate-binding protein, partial [Rhodospirillales bacterium]|nr:zinc ABC transporter substrate-binding protein [Rhodospirillales bacterium]
LAPIANHPYIVFHDAYQYFETRYGLAPAGSITVNPEIPASARRLSEIREKIVDAGATCVFSEPQFEPAVVQTLVEGTEARTGTLDPLGADLETGPNAYFTLMRNLAKSLTRCFDPTG